VKRSVVAVTLLSGLVAIAMLAGITPANAATHRPPAVKAHVIKSRSIGSAITSTWAWGNSVAKSADARGLAESAMKPDAIADFAADHHLRIVYLSAPWASDQGAIATWLSASVDALHAKGIEVAALGGDASWISQPNLAVQWISAARRAAAFDAIQLDVEPWVGAQNPDFSAITANYLTLLAQARPAAGSLTLGIDAPWWLATKRFGSGSAFDALVRAVDSVAIVTFVDHAIGPDGIVDLATPAVASAVAAGRSFTVGVETDLPSATGGAQFTFYDTGSAVLESETAKVRAAFSALPGYGGVTVEHLLAWQALIAARA
jgi:hypothetical protein